MALFFKVQIVTADDDGTALLSGRLVAIEPEQERVEGARDDG